MDISANTSDLAKDGLLYASALPAINLLRGYAQDRSFNHPRAVDRMNTLLSPGKSPLRTIAPSASVAPTYKVPGGIRQLGAGNPWRAAAAIGSAYYAGQQDDLKSAAPALALAGLATAGETGEIVKRTKSLIGTAARHGFRDSIRNPEFYRLARSTAMRSLPAASVLAMPAVAAYLGRRRKKINERKALGLDY